MSDKQHFVSVRVTEENKEAFHKLPSKFGYPDFSKFLEAVLKSLVVSHDEEGWRCQMVHLEGDRIVIDETSAGLRTAGFRIVAPEAFWRYIESGAKHGA